MWLLLAAPVLAAPDSFAGCDNTDPKWVVLHNDAVRALETEELEAAARAARKAAERQPRCRADLHLLAESLFRLADPGAAAVAIEGARLYPDDPTFPTLYSRIAFAAQDFDAALDAALRAARLAPGDTLAVAQVVYVLLRQGDYARAEQVLVEATALPAADVACLRVRILDDQGRDAEALSQMEACATSTNPSLVASSRAALPRGADSSTDDLAAHPDRARIQATLDALSLVQSGDYRAAEPVVQGLLAQEPWNAAWRATYATCLLRNGKKAQARKELDQLFEAENWVTINPTGTLSGVTTKGTELAVAEMLEAALGQLVRTLTDDHSWPDAHVALRRAEARFGRTPTLLAEELHLARLEEGVQAAWKVAPAIVRSWPEEQGILFEASTLVFEAPAAAPADVLDLLLAHGSPRTLHNTLAGLANGRHPTCGRAALTALPRVAPEDRAWTRQVGYSCALTDADLATADALLAIGAEGLAAEERAWHAHLLLEAGQAEAAGKLARTVVTDTAGEPTAIAVLVTLAKARGDDAEVQRLAAHPAAPPFVRLNAAIDQFNAGRYAEARALVQGMDCGSLEGNASACSAFLEALAAAK